MSTADLMVDSTFASAESSKNYSKNSEQIKIADLKVRPFTASRACLNFAKRHIILIDKTN